MIVSSFVFAVLHATVTHIIIATLFGIMLTLSYEYTSCSFIPIIGHSIYNFMALFMTNDMFFGSNNIAVLIVAIIFVVIVIFQVVKLNNKKKKEPSETSFFFLFSASAQSTRTIQKHGQCLLHL